MINQHRSGLFGSKLSRVAGVVGLLGLTLLARAAAPDAGSTIGNAATATYTDTNGQERQVTSNTVTTIVQQVHSFTLVDDRTATVAPGGQVSFPHTLTNTGNGSDTYTIAAANNGAGDDFDLNNLQIFADVNQDGIPDNSTDINGDTITLAAGDEYHFVIVGSAPGTQTTGDADVTVTATPGTGAAATNDDTATVTSDAVITVTKSISRNSGDVPLTTAASTADPLTYTLVYTNTGNTAATDLTITDLIPTGMTYITGSARWSITGTTALTDADAADNQSGVVYDYNVTTATTATWVIASVNPGASGTVSFQVRVNENIVPQTISNTAQFSYDPDGAGADPAITPVPSNTVPYTVDQVVSVEIGNIAVTNDTEGENAPNNGTSIGEVASASPGATITFVNQIINNGNGTDSFDVTIPTENFPAGTTFFLFKPDGNTPLVDNNGNGTPDTGPMGPGDVFNLTIKAILPNSGVTAGPFTATSKVVSFTDPSVDNTAVNTLTAGTQLTVDLTNNDVVGGANVLGEGAYADGNPARVTENTTGGNTVTFDYYANNPNGIPDIYNIAVSSTEDFAPVDGFPDGWTVVIKDPTTGEVLTSTGVVPAGGNKRFQIEVTPPPGTAPGNTDVFVRIQSPNTGVVDRIRDTVTIDEVRELTLTPNNSGQVFPGGSIFYEHTLTNQGNVTEGSASSASAPGTSFVALTLADNLASAGWTSTVYYDFNGNGTLDGADSIVSDLSFTSDGGAGLAPGESVRLFTQVFAPPGATDLAANVTTLTATISNSTGAGGLTTAVPDAVSAVDTTTIVVGDLSIQKTQVLDADCSATEINYELARITTGAIPGACVRYQITVTNTGSSTAEDVVVYDVVPAFTALEAGSATVTGGGSTNTVSVSGSNIEFTIGDLEAGEVATCRFDVKINE